MKKAFKNEITLVYIRINKDKPQKNNVYCDSLIGKCNKQCLENMIYVIQVYTLHRGLCTTHFRRAYLDTFSVHNIRG